jgi:plastocyanin
MAPARITEPFLSVLSLPRTTLRLGICLAILTLAVTGGTPTTAASNPGLAAPATGKIEGTVRLIAPEGSPIASGAYPSRRVSRPPVRQSEISNVVVFVKDAPRDGALPAMRAQMRQQDEGFLPRLLAITRGSTVEFPNGDPFFHNVFSLSRGATFDLGRFPRGESRSRAFTHPGLVKVYCHLHSQMTASIMVFDHSHFTIPSVNGGHFSLADVPAGEYRLSAWHERIGESSKSIVVSAGRTATIEFALPVETQ